MKAKYAALAGLASGLLLAACTGHEEPAAKAVSAAPANEVWITPLQARETAIATAPVAMREVGNTLAATGHVAFSDERVAHVVSPVTGRVTAVLAALGDKVRRGTPLAVIESPDLASAVADREKADADLLAAQRDYQRQHELFDAHAAARRDFEAAESAYMKARAERDRAAQKAAMLGGGHAFQLRSPIDGEVVARNVPLGLEMQGQYSGGGSPELFTIGNLDPVWVIADIYEVDLPRVHLGAPVRIRVVSYPDRELAGRVDWISGALDPATRTVKVRCVVGNADHLLRPEMYATVVLSTDTRPRLAVPRTAVVRLGDQTVAFVDRGAAPNGDRRFERRLVRVDDAQASDLVAVVSGLEAGENVVTSGAIMLSGSPS